MKNSFRLGIAAILFFFFVPAAFAQNVQVSGSVTDTNAAAFSQTVQVRAWSWADDELIGGERYTGYTVRASTFINTSGQYSLSLPPGTYKLDVRVGVTTRISPCSTLTNDSTRPPCWYPAYVSGNASTVRFWLEERWHRAESGRNHWIQEDGVTLNLTAGQNPITELNFEMRLGGAVTALVRNSSNNPTAGFLTRVERTADFRRHHNAVTLPNQPSIAGQTQRRGRFYARGLTPGAAHRVIIHDKDGRHRTYVLPSAQEHTPVVGQLHNFGTITLQAMDTDPYPLNRDESSAFAIGRWNFDQEPPPTWGSTVGSNLARIAPRNTHVVNWFCWNVVPGDRFIVTATTLNTVTGLTGRYHPWMDPILRISNRASPDSPAPGTVIDRYSGPGPLDAQVDTGAISVTAEYCAAVSTAGDFNFTGQGQYIAGPYVLEIAMGNRPPILDVYHGATHNPPSVTIEEGQDILLDVEYSDPEGDSLTRSFTFRQGSTNIPGSNFVHGPNSGTWTWTAPLDGAGSYTVNFTVSDGEWPVSRAVNINVGGVNFPPNTPALESPEDGATVQVRRPTLITNTTTDPDGPDSNLLYHFEAFDADPSVGSPTPIFTATRPHHSSGFLGAAPEVDLPEKSTVWWRVRADDQQAENRYSNWSETWSFFVHAEPPEIEPYIFDEDLQENVLVTDILQINEGDPLYLDLAFRAPFGPIPDLSLVMVDAHGVETDTAELTLVDSGIENEGAAIFEWVAGPLDSANSPYEITFTVFDGLYTDSAVVDVDVLPFNLPPTAPVIVQPEDEEEIGPRNPVVIAQNAEDPEGEDLFLHFEVATDENFVTVVASSEVDGISQAESGTTEWRVSPDLLWGNFYYIRAHATDDQGLAGPFSNVVRIFVLPRTAPVILEPTEDQTVSTREPTIRVQNAHDPAGAPLLLQVEIASDIGFSDIVAGSDPQSVPQDASGETTWTVNPALVFGESYYVRARGIDTDGLEGPNSAPVNFNVRANTAPSSSTLAGPFAAQCTNAVITESPLDLVIAHGTDPDGDPVQLHIQIYPHGTDPETAVDIDMMVPADTDGDFTNVEIDISTLPDNTRYMIRVRSYDGIDYSSWHTCDFWSNTRNSPPTALQIITPEPGTVLPLNTTEVTVLVQNAYDPEWVVPGTSLHIVWCSSLDEEFGDCPESVSEWNSVPQSSLDPADTTEFVVDGITNREAWHIKACAMDETGLCGPADTTWVVADGEESGHGDAPTGCCTTSPSGDPWLAMIALFALVLLTPRRRREVC